MALLRLASVLLVLALPAASSAGKIYLSDDTTQVLYQFEKLKVPKKPDSAAPVAGLAFSISSANALPVSGTIIRDGNTGKIFLGLTRFFQECLVQATLDDSLSGSVSYDCNFDGANDGTYVLTLVTCP